MPYLKPAEIGYIKRTLESGGYPNMQFVLTILPDLIQELEEYRNAICWNADCVHLAKALDISYGEYLGRQKWREWAVKTYPSAAKAEMTDEELRNAIEDYVQDQFYENREDR